MHVMVSNMSKYSKINNKCQQCLQEFIGYAHRKYCSNHCKFNSQINLATEIIRDEKYLRIKKNMGRHA